MAEINFQANQSYVDQTDIEDPRDFPVSNTVASNESTVTPVDTTMKSTDNGELTSAEQQAVTEVVGAGAGILTSIVGGAEASHNTKRAREDARQLAEQAREDDLRQKVISNRFNTKAREQEEKQFSLNARKQKFDLKFARLQKEIQKEFNRGADIRDKAKKVASVMMENEQARNTTLQMWGV